MRVRPPSFGHGVKGGGPHRYLAHAICVTSDRSGRLDSADNLCAPRGVPVPPLFGRRHPYDHSVRPPTSVSCADPAPIAFHSQRYHSCALMITWLFERRPRNLPPTSPRRHGRNRPPRWHAADAHHPRNVLSAARARIGCGKPR